jgi:hypothetical protein
MNDAVARTGRRAKDQKRVPLSMRITPRVRQRLEAQAAETGQSITQQAEFRLEQSFERQDLLEQALVLAYGPQFAGLLLVLAHAMNLTGRRATWEAELPFDKIDAWLSHPYVFGQLALAVSTLFAGLRPPGDPVFRQPGHIHVTASVPEVLGQHIATALLSAIKNPDEVNQNLPDEEQNRSLEAFGQKTRALLGPSITVTVPPLARRPARKHRISEAAATERNE